MGALLFNDVFGTEAEKKDGDWSKSREICRSQEVDKFPAAD